jgi:hypothetical protein
MKYLKNISILLSIFLLIGCTLVATANADSIWQGNVYTPGRYVDWSISQQIYDKSNDPNGPYTTNQVIATATSQWGDEQNYPIDNICASNTIAYQDYIAQPGTPQSNWQYATSADPLTNSAYSSTTDGAIDQPFYQYKITSTYNFNSVSLGHQWNTNLYYSYNN